MQRGRAASPLAKQRGSTSHSLRSLLFCRSRVHTHVVVPVLRFPSEARDLPCRSCSRLFCDLGPHKPCDPVTQEVTEIGFAYTQDVQPFERA